MNLFVVFLCAVSICGVKSECTGAECVDEFVNEFLDNKTQVENVDISIDLPHFEQIKNVDINEFNTILLQLTNWFEDKLNETNIIYKNVNNNTKIFVKSFDFNVDFEKGNVNIDVGLTESKVTNVTAKETNHTETPLESNKKPMINIVEKSKVNVDNNEIFNIDEFDTTYYDLDEDNSTDYPVIDYIEMYKDTTNEHYVFTGTEPPATAKLELEESDNTSVVDNSIEELTSEKPSESICHDNATCEEFTMAVYPWLVAIFVKNDSSNQFSYHCDGSLVSERIILTDARCVHASNQSLDPENILVFLGKGSLQIMSGNEKIQKIKEIVVHENFTASGEPANDLALLVMEEPVEFTNAIQGACLRENGDEEVDEAATTAWGLNGELMPIFFNKPKSDNCFDKDDNIFCATYGNHVALCPSYGGVYAVRSSNKWCLQGVFYGDPAERGICFTKNVHYTSLNNYLQWIDNVISVNKNDL